MSNEEEWVVGATYTNKHNGGTIRIVEREVMDSGTVLYKAVRVGGEDDGQTTFLSKRDIRHWTMARQPTHYGTEEQHGWKQGYRCPHCTKPFRFGVDGWGKAYPKPDLTDAYSTEEE